MTASSLPSTAERHTLPRSERLRGRHDIDSLFAGGARSAAAFPVRAVYKVVDRGREPAVRMMVSVSKSHFKRAVKRNRAKRLMREAYRIDKQLLTAAVEAQEGRGVMLALIWMSDQLHTQAEVRASVASLLSRIAERL